MSPVTLDMAKARKASRLVLKHQFQVWFGVVLAGLLSQPATASARASKTAAAPATEDRRASALCSDSVATFAAKVMPEAMARGRVPGAVFVVVRGDQVLFSEAYGQADVREDRPVSLTGTLFRMASISKIVTAAVALDLVAKGGLDLHRNVNRYLSRFRIDPAFHKSIMLGLLRPVFYVFFLRRLLFVA